MIIKDKGKDRVKEKGRFHIIIKSPTTPSRKTKISVGVVMAIGNKSAIPQKRKNVL